MTPTRDDQFADLVTALVADSAAARPGWVDDERWGRAKELASIERELRLSVVAAPPLHLDKTAAMLGLVPTPDVQLDPRRVRMARARARLKPTAVADQLTAKGWHIAARDVFRWESQAVTDVSPALMEALAEVLHVRRDDLVQAHPAPAPGLVEDNPAMRNLVGRFAAVFHLDWQAALTRLNAVAAASVHRGERPGEDELLHRLDLYVTALEDRHGS